MFLCEDAHLTAKMCVRLHLSMPARAHVGMSVNLCVCVCVHVWYSLPKTCCSPAYNTHHYTKDKVLLSNLTLMHPSKLSLDDFQTFPQPLDSSSHYSLSLCRAFCLLHKSRDESCLVLLLEDITEFQTSYQVKMQLMIILN